MALPPSLFLPFWRNKRAMDENLTHQLASPFPPKLAGVCLSVSFTRARARSLTDCPARVSSHGALRVMSCGGVSRSVGRSLHAITIFSFLKYVVGAVGLENFGFFAHQVFQIRRCLLEMHF